LTPDGVSPTLEDKWIILLYTGLLIAQKYVYGSSIDHKRDLENIFSFTW